jgi:hypothetical protein
MSSSISRLVLVASASLLAVVAVATVANARSTTGFNAFKVQNPSAIPGVCSSISNCFAGYYQCLTEDYGAVVNNCPLQIETTPPTNVPLPSLVFDLPIDSAGTKLISVWPYSGSWNPAPEADNPDSFECTGYAYETNGAFTLGGTITFSRPVVTPQSLQVTVQSGGSITLICWNVPSGAGIANINWTPP